MFYSSKIQIKISAMAILILCTVHIPCNSIAKDSAGIIIYKSLSIDGNKEQVWSALTSKTELAIWWNQGVKLEPRVGGEFYEPWGDGQLATGKVLDLEPKKKIIFTWKERSWNSNEQTTCEFSIEESNGKTILKVKHSGWEIFPNTKEQMMEGFSKGWNFLLQKLKNYIEVQIN